jgi:hypothetical protein
VSDKKRKAAKAAEDLADRIQPLLQDKSGHVESPNVVFDAMAMVCRALADDFTGPTYNKLMKIADDLSDLMFWD